MYAADSKMNPLPAPAYGMLFFKTLCMKRTRQIKLLCFSNYVSTVLRYPLETHQLF